MAQVGYSCTTEGEVSLSATTAKTVIGVKAHANSGVQLKGFSVAFKGVSLSDAPVLVEVCYSTFATNPPGTNSTSTTPRQKYGRSLTAGLTSGRLWTTEPTVLTVQEEYLVTPAGGLFAYQYPLGQEPDSALGEGFVIRCTAPADVVVRARLDVERI